VIGGFLKGALTGTIVAGLVAGTASVLAGTPDRGAPQVDTVTVTPGTDGDTRRDDHARALPDADTRPETSDPPKTVNPARDDMAPSTTAASAPASPPEIDGGDTLGDAPAAEDDSVRRADRGDDPVASDPPSRMPDAAEADQPADDARTPALRRNAAGFAKPHGKPLMAVVLMADDSDAVSLETLKGFPYPLSIAVDPGQSDAAEAAARYRDAGFEILLTVDLSNNAAPSEIRAALRSSFAEVTQAVAVLEASAGGLPVAGVAPILGQTGHGLVSRAPQPDPARKVLTLSDVPAAPLQRDLDGQGQGVDAISEALDQAAAEADAQRGVIVLGRMRPDTVRALSLWSGRGGARRVALAPVSAVLSAQDDPQTR
jgi:polysaccharide deacetylase 2 family uncharacterized protein YibQ